MYVKVNNQTVEKFPYTIGDLRKDNPNVSFPRLVSDDILAQYGVFLVQQTNKPNFDEKTQKVEETSPTYTNGTWIQTWVVTNKSSDEIAEHQIYKSKQLRAMRNDLLSRSDWTQVADAPVDQQAWATYRQALRDLPDAPGFPDIDLPRPPAIVGISGNTD